jgi:hypothetical protein
MTSVLLAIAALLVGLAAYVTHGVWFIRFLLFTRSLQQRRPWPLFLGMMGVIFPIVGMIHGCAIWAGTGARVGD